MKKIIYLLMSLSIVALASCNDDDKTSSSPSNAISAADMKKMAGKTLVIKEKDEDRNRTRTTEYIFDSNGRLSKMREEYHDEYGTDIYEYYWDYSNPNCIVHYYKTEDNDPYDFDNELFEQCGGDYRFYNTLYYYNNELYYWGTKRPSSWLSIVDGNAYMMKDSLYYVYSDEHVKSYKFANYIDYPDSKSVYEYDYHFTNGRLTERRYVGNYYEYDKLKTTDERKTVYEYDSKGNPVNIIKKDGTGSDTKTITYTDIKASDLPIEDRIALTIICGGRDMDLVSRVGYVSDFNLFQKHIPTSNLLIKHQEISCDDTSEDYTYYLKDKKVKIDGTCISGDYNREYSWYVK